MLVTVLIPCRDDEHHLPRLMQELESLAALLAPLHFPELLLADGGSVDGTVPLAIAWCERARVPARLIALDAPGEFDEILREAAPLVAGDVVLVIDPSFECPASELVRMVHALAGEPCLVVPHERSVPLGLMQRCLDLICRRILRWRTNALMPREACVSHGPRVWRRREFHASLAAGKRSSLRGPMLVEALLQGGRIASLPIILTRRHSALAARRREALLALRAACGSRQGVQ